MAYSEIMLDWLAGDLQCLTGAQEICDAALGMGLKFTSAPLGNVQLADISGFLKIQSQRGFGESFLKAFETVHPAGGSVCARALRNSASTLVEDVMLDPAFASYRGIAEDAGFRAVCSIPLISRKGAMRGVLSLHFPRPHRPTPAETKLLQTLAGLAADAIERWRTAAGLGADPGIIQMREDIRRLNALTERTHDLIGASRRQLEAAEKLIGNSGRN
jgi:GAF domain-containing protein